MRIWIVSMTTWGEMGNWLSGKSLAALLQASFPDAQVELLAAESLVPGLAEVGAAIKAATKSAATADERFRGYSAILEGLAAVYPEGCERAPHGHPRLREELAGWAELARTAPPDLVIGTKGILCRLALAALRLAGHERPVLNYVTNHGHFQFAVHRVPEAVLHLVRFAEGRDYLVESCGVPADRIEVVGYLIAARQLRDADLAPVASDRPAAGGPAERSAIIVSNRGGREYVELLRALAARGAALQGTFIAIRDPELCAEAEAALAAAGATSWRTVTELGQAELFALLVQARRRGSCLLVVKASPNSIFEAAYFGIPMFLLRTGLPMEEWGADMVVREGLGRVADTMAELIPAIEECLDRPELLAAIDRRLADFSRRHLDQEETARRIVGAVHQALGAGAGAAPAAARADGRAVSG